MQVFDSYPGVKADSCSIYMRIEMNIMQNNTGVCLKVNLAPDPYVRQGIDPIPAIRELWFA
jgi:hypothetical protein